MKSHGLLDRRTGGKRHDHGQYSPVVVQRLLKYHDYLQQIEHRGGRDCVLSTELAMLTRCGSSQVRRDLASIGITANRPKGYPVRSALMKLQSVLGRKHSCRAVLFGAGRVGGLLTQQDWVTEAGVVLTAAFDIDKAKIGGELHGIPVFAVSDATAVIHESGACIAVVAVHPDAAQSCADIAVNAGIRAIWNFTPLWLNLPPSVVVRYENLAAGLTELLCTIAEEVY